MKLTDNEFLREQIIKRLAEIGWKDSDLIKDAEERGRKIEPSSWTKYKKNKAGQIKDDTLVWVATRLGIDIALRFGKPVFDGKSINWKIPPFDELAALTKLYQMYPKK